MRHALIWILMFVVSQSAFAKNYTGKLVCYPSVMNEHNPGMLNKVKISDDNKNTESDLLGPMIVVDLADASAAVQTSVSKTLTSNIFDGEIQLLLAFVYRGEIAAGNLDGVSISLTHKGKNWMGQDTVYARSSSSYPLTEDGTIRMEMFSTGGRLLETEIVCSIRK